MVVILHLLVGSVENKICAMVIVPGLFLTTYVKEREKSVVVPTLLLPVGSAEGIICAMLNVPGLRLEKPA